MATVTPFKIAFLSEFDILFLDILEICVDVFFVLDIIVTFFTPILLDSELVTSHIRIAIQYLKFWFWLDVFSILPFSYFLDSLKVAGVDFLATFLKIPRLYKLIKLSKLSRTLRFKKKRGTLVAHLLKNLGGQEQFILSTIPLYTAVFILSHILCCFWYFQSNTIPDPNSWLLRYSFVDEGVWDKYCASLYYVYSTLTTTGYGDIVPGTNLEFFLTIIYVAVGVSFHSYIYTHMLERFKSANDKSNFFQQKFSILKILKNESNLFNNQRGRRIYREIRVVIDEHKKLDILNTSLPILTTLKPKDRNTLILEMCENHFGFGKLNFFRNIPKRCWIEFYENMERLTFIKGNRIFERGSRCTHFYIIKRGKVFYMTYDAQT